MRIRIKSITGSRGQNLIEYGLILSIVAVALLGMQVYFRRGIQSVIRVTADDFSGYRKQGDPVSDLEVAIKEKAYEKKGNRVTSTSSNTGSWEQTITNSGDSSIYSQLKGSSTSATDSFWIGGDYKTRKIE